MERITTTSTAAQTGNLHDRACAIGLQVAGHWEAVDRKLSALTTQTGVLRSAPENLRRDTLRDVAGRIRDLYAVQAEMTRDVHDRLRELETLRKDLEASL